MATKDFFADLKPSITYTNVLFMLALIIAGGLVGHQSAKFFPSGYRQSQLFFVSEPAILGQNPQEAYFNQEKGRNFTDTATAILSSEEFSLDVLGQKISMSARKLAPQVIRITVQSPEAASLGSTLDTISTTFNSKVESLSQPNKPSQMKPISGPSQVAFFASNKLTISAAGALAGLIAGIFIVTLKFYFKI